MPRLFAVIVRHGSYRRPAGVLGAHLPYSLNDAGRRHAREGGEDILAMAAAHGLQVARIIDSSSLRRAWETAAVIADAFRAHQHEAEVEAFDSLNERSVGAAANLTIAEIERVVADDPRWQPLPPDWVSQSRLRLPLPGAESLIAAGERVAAHMERRMLQLAGATKRDTIKVFVGHSGAFRHAAVLFGLLRLGEVAALSMNHGKPIVWEYQDSYRWRHVAGRWRRRPEAVT